MLASIHNHYYVNLMREVRRALDAGAFAAFARVRRAARRRGVCVRVGCGADPPSQAKAREARKIGLPVRQYPPCRSIRAAPSTPTC